MKSARPSSAHRFSLQSVHMVFPVAKEHGIQFYKLLVFTILGFLFALAGCSEEAPVIAQVGDTLLRRPDFDAFVGNLSPVDQQNSRGAPVPYLQSMVDRELLLLEAGEHSLADEIEITEQVRFEVRARLAEIFQMNVLTTQLEITELEIEREFENSRLNHERFLRRILVRTEDDLNQVLADLAAGRSFREVLEPFAVNDAIAEGDGVVGWFNYAEAERRFRIPRRAFFAAELKRTLPPVRLPKGWQIYSFLDEREGELQAYYEQVRRIVYERQWDAINQQELELLKHKYAVEFNPEALQQLFAVIGAKPIRTAALSDGDGKIKLYTYVGGEMDLIMALNNLRQQGLSGPLPAQQVAADVFEELLLRPLLFEREASERGWAQEEEFLAWKQEMHNKIVLNALMDRNLDTGVNVSEVEAREYYQANKSKFYTPDRVTIRELITDTSEAAMKFREQLEAGVDIGTLLIRRDTDTHGKPRSGELKLTSILASKYPKLVAAAFAAQEDEWVGPLATADGHFAVFEVIERQKPQIEPFDRAQERVTGLLRQQRKNDLIGNYISSLREKYADRVVLYPDRLLSDEES
jgi:parvulin-like peptidyl-prolyl isomerase